MAHQTSNEISCCQFINTATLFGRNWNYRFYAAILSLMAQVTVAQIPDFSKIPNLYPEDSANIVYLIKNGVKVNKGKVTAWFPRDSLSNGRMEEIVDTLEMGIRAAEKYIRAPLPWQVQQKEKEYTYYFRMDRFISHASDAGFVSIPFWRIKRGRAPWLHEALHEMLNTKAAAEISENEWASYEPHLWLFEGLPDYIAMEVSQRNNLRRFDPFSNATAGNVDSLCKKNLAMERSAYTLSYIGRKGVMPELFSKDRISYAPAFYHCSCSFVKYLVEKFGIEHLLNVVAVYPREQALLEKSMKPPLDVLKVSWLEKIEGLKEK